MKYSLTVLALFALVSTVSAVELINVSAYYLSAAALPIGQVNATLRDSSDNTTIESILSDNTTGLVSFVDVNTTDYPETNILVRYPSNQYSATLGNITCDSEVFLNDFGSVSLVLKNTIGEFLENQDGRVFVTEKDDLSKVVRDFDTRCTFAGDYVDTNGNLAQVTECPVTDSRGNYLFVFPVNADEGFFYNTEYTVHIVINGETSTCDFNVTNPRRADMDLIEVEAKTWSGLIMLIGVVLIVIVLVLGAILNKLRRRGARR